MFRLERWWWDFPYAGGDDDDFDHGVMWMWRWLILARNSMSTCGHGIAGCEPGWELAPSLLCRCWRFCFSSSTRSFFYLLINFFHTSHFLLRLLSQRNEVFVHLKDRPGEIKLEWIYQAQTLSPNPLFFLCDISKL